MKIFIQSTIALLLTTSAMASTQYIDCRSYDTSAEDRVIVSLSSETKGTFFYTEGLDSEGNSRNTKILTLTREQDQGDQALFTTQFIGDDYGTPTQLEFSFLIHKSFLMKASTSFTANFAINGASSELICFSTLN